MTRDTDTSSLEQELDELTEDDGLEEAADTTSLQRAFDARAAAWQRWIDELRVQAALGGQDARAVLGDVLGRLEDAAAALTSLTRQAIDDVKVDDLRERGRAAAHDLDRAARTALDRLRG